MLLPWIFDTYMWDPFDVSCRTMEQMTKGQRKIKIFIIKNNSVVEITRFDEQNVVLIHKWSLYAGLIIRKYTVVRLIPLDPVA